MAILSAKIKEIKIVEIKKYNPLFSFPECQMQENQYVYIHFYATVC